MKINAQNLGKAAVLVTVAASLTSSLLAYLHLPLAWEVAVIALIGGLTAEVAWYFWPFMEATK